VSAFDHNQDNELFFYLFSVLEVILLSFTLTERYLFLRKEKEQSQREIIQYQQRMLEESREKERLKETLNQELETLVDQRTAELQQASEQLRQQAQVITEMNKCSRRTTASFRSSSCW
jgi:vacuolar-type H+-ATPase subunit I/STV1